MGVCRRSLSLRHTVRREQECWFNLYHPQLAASAPVLIRSACPVWRWRRWRAVASWCKPTGPSCSLAAYAVWPAAGGSGTDIPLGQPGRTLHESCVRENFCFFLNIAKILFIENSYIVYHKSKNKTTGLISRIQFYFYIIALFANSCAPRLRPYYSIRLIFSRTRSIP